MKTLTPAEIDKIVQTFFGYTHDAMTCRHAINEAQKALRVLNKDAHNQIQPDALHYGVPIQVFFNRLNNEKRAEFLAMMNRGLNTWDTGPAWLFDLCSNLERQQAEASIEHETILATVTVSDMEALIKIVSAYGEGNVHPVPNLPKTDV